MEKSLAFEVDALLHAPVVFSIRSRRFPPCLGAKSRKWSSLTFSSRLTRHGSRRPGREFFPGSIARLQLTPIRGSAGGIAENANREMDIIRIAENNLIPLIQAHLS